MKVNRFLIITLSTICVLLMFYASGPFDNFSVRVYLTSVIIIIISIINVFSNDKQPFSLYKTFFLFSLFFFGISPLLQFYGGVSQYGARFLKEYEYFYTNLLIIVILLLYQLFYNNFYRKKVKDKYKKIIFKYNINKKLNVVQSGLIISLSIISFLLIFNANNNSIISMLFRGGELKDLVQMSSTKSIIIFRFFQPLVMMCLLYYISSKSKNILVLLILILLVVITCSPLGMPRFSAAAMYIPLLLLIIPFIKKKNVFSIVLIFGLLIIFPFLDNFRHFSGNSINFGFNFDMFLVGHFDSYQSLVLVVSDNIVTWGRQLLGVIFFWLPRSFWPNKPIGSGAFMAEELDLVYANISCNYFAEGYINFGFLGIFIFIIALSFVTAKLDKMYWSVSYKNSNNFFNVIYFVLIGMLIFILRGDLLSSFAYTIGFMLSIWLVKKVAGFSIKRV